MTKRTIAKRTIALGPFKRALLLGALGGTLALVDLLLIVPAAEGLDCDTELRRDCRR
jgi:hypothetical protein